MARDSFFTNDSMIRRVQRESVVALAGPRTLLMQAAHPVAFAGLLRPHRRARRPVRAAPADGPRARPRSASATRPRPRRRPRACAHPHAHPRRAHRARRALPGRDAVLRRGPRAAAVDPRVHGRLGARGLPALRPLAVPRRARRVLAGLQGRRPRVRPARRGPARRDRGLRALHGRDGRGRRPVRDRRGPRARARDRHAPARLAPRAPDGRGRELRSRSACCRASCAGCTASRGTRPGRWCCAAGRSTPSASWCRCCRTGSGTGAGGGRIRPRRGGSPRRVGPAAGSPVALRATARRRTGAGGRLGEGGVVGHRRQAGVGCGPGWAGRHATVLARPPAARRTTRQRSSSARGRPLREAAGAVAARRGGAGRRGPDSADMGVIFRPSSRQPMRHDPPVSRRGFPAHIAANPHLDPPPPPQRAPPAS